MSSNTITLIFCLGGITFLANWIFILSIYFRANPLELNNISGLIKLLLINLAVSIFGVLAMGVLFVTALMVSHG